MTRSIGTLRCVEVTLDQVRCWLARRRSHGAERRLADAEPLHADRGLCRAGRQDRRPQAVADYTQGGLTNDPLSYTRKLHHIDGRDRPRPTSTKPLRDWTLMTKTATRKSGPSRAAILAL